MWAKVLASRGMLAVSIFATVTLWLGFEGKLSSYIHPRYNLFTLAMAGVGLMLVVIAAATRETHNHDHDDQLRKRRYRVADVLSASVTTGLLLVLIILPPATLSSATAENRSSNDVAVLSSVETFDDQASLELFGTLTVRDWAVLLMQNQNPSYYRGKPVNAIGMVTPSGTSDDVFNLTRFVITCCAVDARPVSIPVYQPGWQESISVNSWLRIEGGFAPSPEGIAAVPLLLVPVKISQEEVPRDPYLF